MLRVQYAAQTSQGALAGQIGWVDWGQGFTLTPSQTPITVRNYIRGGYFLTFQISAIATITPTTSQIPTLNSTTSPVVANAPFGSTYYTGIGGYPALYLSTAPDISTSLTYTVAISNIEVCDSYGCQITNYTIYAADAETTNQSSTGVSEIWQATTDGGSWNMTQTIPAVNGATTGPDITGLNTSVVTETGAATSFVNTVSYVYSTVDPSNLTYYFQTVGGNQALALGIVITPRPKPLLLTCGCCQRVNYLTSTLAQTFTVCMNNTLQTVQYNGQTYTISAVPTVITGNLATYSVTSTGIVATPLAGATIMTDYPVQETDVLQITYIDSCDYSSNINYGSLVFASCIPS